MMEDKKKQNINKFFWMGCVFLALCTLMVMYALSQNHYFASGKDAWGHLFKSNLMYENLQEGNFYPLYTEFWYNGVQPYRYWAPFPYYLLATLQGIGDGSIEISYYLFAGFSFFVGGFAFLLWGKANKRLGLATFLAVIWFFLPENTRVFFGEGNIPRMVTHFIIPYVVYFMWRFMEKKEDSAMLGIILSMMLMTLSHVMLAAMMGIGSFMFLFFYILSKRECWKRAVAILVGMLIAFLICGIWLLPALSGGLVGMDEAASASVMQSLAYDLKVSLNPMNRLTGITDTFYYGIAIVVISLLGLLLGRQKEKAGYITALLILILTTSSAVPILSKIPLSQLLWMMRFATIAYAFVFWSLLSWRQIKKGFCLFLMLLLVVDCAPSLVWQRYYTQEAGEMTSSVETIKSITNQRVAILDLSLLGSYPSYALSHGENKIGYTFGWAWQGASTSENIVLINTALEKERFNYLFDRSLEMGNDTVAVAKREISLTREVQEALFLAAASSGYKLYEENEKVYIFHRETPQQFGVSTVYEGIAIGKYGTNMSLNFPAFTTGDSLYIDDYSEEELARYKAIYLSGFKYHDKAASESLLRRLSDKGVKILIDMSHIPVDQSTRRMTFMDVTAEDIVFEERYPILEYKGEPIEATAFDEKNKRWQTMYLQHVPYIEGRSQLNGEALTFLGKGNEKNITFMGFNLVYYALETQDSKVMDLIEKLTGIKENTLPKRTLIPLEISYETSQITIKKEGNERVNTTLAYQDSFDSALGMSSYNHLLYVTEPVTVITMHYPYLKIGATMSLLGIGLGILLIWGIKNLGL